VIHNLRKEVLSIVAARGNEMAEFDDAHADDNRQPNSRQRV
jgi:hypothetical protein